MLSTLPGKELKSLTVDVGKRHELHRVESPLAQLALGDVRLRLLEALGDLLLREPGGAARLPQPGEQGPIPFRVD